MSDSLELLKPDEVTDGELQSKICNELQTKIGNLESENEELRRQLENSDRLVKRKNQEISELNSRLAAANKTIAEQDEENSDCLAGLRIRNEEIENLKSTIQNLNSELASRSEQIAAPIAIGLPEAADLLNQLKGRRKKSRADLADINAILGLLAEEYGSNPV